MAAPSVPNGTLIKLLLFATTTDQMFLTEQYVGVNNQTALLLNLEVF